MRGYLANFEVIAGNYVQGLGIGEETWLKVRFNTGFILHWSWNGQSSGPDRTATGRARMDPSAEQRAEAYASMPPCALEPQDRS